MATPTGMQAMPVRGNRTCPVFDETKPRSLYRYLADLDALFAKHGVLNAAVDDWKNRKELAIRYLPEGIEVSWMTLLAYRDDTKTFDDFKAEVYKLYPNVRSTREFMTDDLRRLIREQLEKNQEKKKSKILDIDEYTCFYVRALPMLRDLLAKSRITHTEANSSLAEVLDPSLQNSIILRLEHAYPNRSPDTPYTLDQFHDATTYVLQHWNDDAEAIFRSARTAEETRAGSSSTAPPPTAQGSIKIEEVASIAELLSKTIGDAVAKAMPPAPRDRPPHMGGGYGGGFGRGRGDRNDHPRCYYCGKEGCTTRSCPEAAEDIAARKIRRDNTGQLVMYDGSRIPIDLPGRNMRERVNTYCDTHPGTAPRPAENLLLEIPEGASMETVSVAETNFVQGMENVDKLDAEERYHLKALNAIHDRRKYKFDSVVIPQRLKAKTTPQDSDPTSEVRAADSSRDRGSSAPAGPSASRVDSPIASSSKDKGKERAAPMNETPKAPNANKESGELPVHPYTTTRPVNDAGPLPTRPQVPFRGVESRSAEPAYRAQVPALDATADDRVFDRTMDALPFVSLSLSELLSVAPGVRKRLHEATGTRRVLTKPPELKDLEGPARPQTAPSSRDAAPKEAAPKQVPGILRLKEPLPPRQGPPVLSAFIEEEPDIDSDFVDPAPPDAPTLPEARPLDRPPGDPRNLLPLESAPIQAPLFATEVRASVPVTGCERKAVRVLWCLVNNFKMVECILDGGSQIIAMSEECCRRNKIPVDPFVGLDVQSANGSLDNAIGLARNVPFQLTPEIIAFLQVFVMRNATYDVLLGRPFESLMNMTTENLDPDSHFVTVECPNTKISARIPTSARGEHKAPPVAQVKGFQV